MRPWIKLATRLYPSPWRQRYGNEFQALLEDMNPGWSELFNVFGGAIKMQLTTGATYLKLGAAFAIAGLVVATVASFVIPKEYTSTAVLMIINTTDLAKAEQNVLTRNSLSQIIQDPALQLYPSERSNQPLEDVIEYMRTRAIHISVVRDMEPTASIRISFRYTDKKKAQAVVRLLIEKLSEAFQTVEVSPKMAILDPPSLPLLATSPKRWVMLTTGLAGGLLVGLIAAVFVKHPRRSLVFATMGFIGCLIGGAASFLVANRYISSAVIRITPYGQNFEQRVKGLGRPGLRIQVMAQKSPAGGAAIKVSFEDTDPKRARATVEATISKLINGTLQTGTVRPPPFLEILDNANIPLRPSGPNRMMISLLGVCVGFVAAGTTLLIQNRRVTKLA
jgi:capsular polysaccharide biosynthesis protein